MSHKNSVISKGDTYRDNRHSNLTRSGANHYDDEQSTTPGARSHRDKKIVVRMKNSTMDLDAKDINNDKPKERMCGGCDSCAIF